MQEPADGRAAHRDIVDFGVVHVPQQGYKVSEPGHEVLVAVEAQTELDAERVGPGLLVGVGLTISKQIVKEAVDKKGLESIIATLWQRRGNDLIGGLRADMVVAAANGTVGAGTWHKYRGIGFQGSTFEGRDKGSRWRRRLPTISGPNEAGWLCGHVLDALADRAEADRRGAGCRKRLLNIKQMYMPSTISLVSSAPSRSERRSRQQRRSDADSSTKCVELLPEEGR